jgi:hypothetical protein
VVQVRSAPAARGWGARMMERRQPTRAERGGVEAGRCASATPAPESGVVTRPADPISAHPSSSDRAHQDAPQPRAASRSLLLLLTPRQHSLRATARRTHFQVACTYRTPQPGPPTPALSCRRLLRVLGASQLVWRVARRLLCAVRSRHSCWARHTHQNSAALREPEQCRTLALAARRRLSLLPPPAPAAVAAQTWPPGLCPPPQSRARRRRLHLDEPQPHQMQPARSSNRPHLPVLVARAAPTRRCSPRHARRSPPPAVRCT